MLRPRKMKLIELTVLKNDIDNILGFLGKRRVIHFHETANNTDSPEIKLVQRIIERLSAVFKFTGIDAEDADLSEEDIYIPGKEDEELVEKYCTAAEEIKNKRDKTEEEQQRIQEALSEVLAFSKMNVPFSELEQLSYISLRVGHLDPKSQAELRKNFGDRAVIIPLGDGNRILAASSKKGRFTMDSQLKKVPFEPSAIPKDYKGIPADMVESLRNQLERIKQEIIKIDEEKESLRRDIAEDLIRLYLSWNKALVIEELKSKFTVTQNLYHFTGWIPADIEAEITKGLFDLTKGRIAIKTYSPEQVPSVADGTEKVPVSMKHGSFAKGFEGVVFSYGAPLYGTIDPTLFVAFFFTILFGIMFGDVGQGFVLFLLGILIKKSTRLFVKFSKYSVPLISVGISSMFMGLLTGTVFTNESLLIEPTRAVTAAITGQPVNRILHILPMASEGGSVTKLFYFFGFTVAIGVLLNSTGLLINIINRCILKKYEAAFFSKTGLAGLLMFWYALFIAVRLLLGGSFYRFDIMGLSIPVLCIFFGPVIWRIIAGERPVLEHGLMTFIMEGFVEVLETISSYISNTVSFLRVGAFALSHAVLSFIVFRFSEEMAASGVAGSVSAVFIIIAGNIIIILLEGMIVAIQVVRLQYYEFFNKFFIETGVEFAPFRIKTKNYKEKI